MTARWLWRADLPNPIDGSTGLDLSRTLELVRPVFGLMKGIPTHPAPRVRVLAKKMPPPADAHPDRDRRGLIWCAPVAPATGESVAALVAIAETTLLEHGFEPMISLTMIMERAVACDLGRLRP